MTELRFRFWVVFFLAGQTLLLVYFIFNVQKSEKNRTTESQQLVNLVEDQFIQLSAALDSQSIALRQTAMPQQVGILAQEGSAQQAGAQQASAQPPQTTPVLTKEEIEQQEQQYSNSDAIISAAIAVGKWTEQDTRNLLPHMGNLSYEQRIALLEKFHSAVNRQELNLEAFPPL